MRFRVCFPHGLPSDPCCHESLTWDLLFPDVLQEKQIARGKFRFMELMPTEGISLRGLNNLLLLANLSSENSLS
jgi:hypothetical protein